MHMHVDDKRKEAVRVTWIGAIVDTLLGVAKIIAGLIYNSHALVADGIHSLSDLVTDFMVVFIVGVSHEEPDEEHPYGHERFETLGTVVLGFLLVAVAGAMAYESTLNLINADQVSLPGWPALVIAGISILSKEWIFRYTMAVGKRLKSDLLIANAWHSRTDAYSSIVVFIGIGGAMAGFPWLDSLAALAVALFVAKIGWDLSWKSLRELVDTAIPQEELDRIKQVAMDVEGVQDVHSFKSRQMGPKILLEMHLQVHPYLSVSEGHYIGDTVVMRLLKEFTDIGHIIFHIDSEDDDEQRVCLLLPMRSEITALIDQQLEEHTQLIRRERLTLHYLKGRIELELRVKSADGGTVDHSALSAVYQAMLPHLQQQTWFSSLTLYQRA
ncbi:cation diffusion facilitator family transporter [Motiliproteus sediminis]|uniref:cation diffusion facilitator family transporter n=1 Tax=Motiliproteus sediminis TaxID=1468178 RepID=UPI001FE8C63A|nr:cation diffusion facilitator family transporter [Motiliproteus sediminis]